MLGLKRVEPALLLKLFGKGADADGRRRLGLLQPLEPPLAHGIALVGSAAALGAESVPPLQDRVRFRRCCRRLWRLDGATHLLDKAGRWPKVVLAVLGHFSSSSSVSAARRRRAK